MQRAGSSVGIAILVTVLSAQVGTASVQASCTPPPEVLASAPAHAMVGSHDLATPVSAAELCTAFQTQAQNSSQDQRSEAQGVNSPSHAFNAFAKSYGDEMRSIAFDRTFAVTAILTALGLLPALFLRKPEKHAMAGPRHAAMEA